MQRKPNEIDVDASSDKNVSYVVIFNEICELALSFITKNACSYTTLIFDVRAQATASEADKYALKRIKQRCLGVSQRKA